MPLLPAEGPALHWREAGDPSGTPVVFAHGLGLDLRIWDAVLPLLPSGFRFVTYDLRGHGGSDCPPPPYAMGMLVRDAESLMERLGLKGAVFVGLGLGGMVAQGLAVKRPDLLRAMVLVNSASKIGTPGTWEPQIRKLRESGIEAVAEDVVSRWFPRSARLSEAATLWRARLMAMAPDGYIGGCQAMAGTDFYATTARLTLPTLVLAGAGDGMVPPDLVRETADLVAGAEFQLIQRAGHLACVDAPESFAGALRAFLERLPPVMACGCGGHHDHAHGHDHDHDHDHGHHHHRHGTHGHRH